MKKNIMTEHNDIITVIPARMGSSRLPNKPMADIAGQPMIVHVWKQAVAASLGPVLVACDNQDIINVIENEGGIALMTDPELPSGSDRIYAALCEFDPDETYRRVINLQGDLPDIPPNYLSILASMLLQEEFDLCTLVAPCAQHEINAPQVVKAVMSWQTNKNKDGLPIGRAHYFSRAPIPHGSAIYWHHIGIYGWQRESLSQFVKTPPSALEKTESLEQLRALELGLIIGAGQVNSAAAGIDTEQDLIYARSKYSKKADTQ